MSISFPQFAPAYPPLMPRGKTTTLRSPAQTPFSTFGAPQQPFVFSPIEPAYGNSLASHFFSMGEKAYRANRFAEAERAYSQVLALTPGDYVTLNKRGVVRASLKDFAGALSDYNEAIRVQPGFYKAYINRGNLRAYFKDLHGALTDFQKAIQLAPMESAGYENASEIYSALGDSKSALQHLNLAIVIQRMKKSQGFRYAQKFCPPRIALVMANDNYAGDTHDLNGGPANDGKQMKRVLESQGFQVIYGQDLSASGMRMLVNSYMKRLQQFPGAVSFIYYSGHGGSIQGDNYFIPTDQVDIKDPRRFMQEALSIRDLQQMLKQVPTLFNIMVIDACRTPLAPELDVQLQATPAMRKNWEVEPAPGLANVWIEYASRPSMPALQHGTEGLYTKYLLHYMQQPGLSLKEASMYASYALEQDPVARAEGQHARTQTDLTYTEPLANAFEFSSPCMLVTQP